MTLQRVGLLSTGWRSRPTETTLKSKQTPTNQPTPPWNPAPGEEQPQVPAQAATNQLEISFAGKALGVLKDKMNHDTVLAAKASSTWGCVRQSIPSRLSGDSFLLPSTGETNLECWILCWAPQAKGNRDAQEWAQQRDTEVIMGLSVCHMRRGW